MSKFVNAINQEVEKFREELPKLPKRMPKKSSNLFVN